MIIVDAKHDAGAGTGEEGFSPAPTVPDAWERAEGACWISLRGLDLRVGQPESAEHCVATFADEHCSYRVEYGEIADAFADAQGELFAREQVRVEGARAWLVTTLYRLDSDAYLVGLHVPSYEGTGDPPGYALNATARCTNEQALADARIVLQTVELPHVGSGLCEPVRPQKCSIL